MVGKHGGGFGAVSVHTCMQAHDAVHDYPHVVAQALGHDIEMPPCLFTLRLNGRCNPDLGRQRRNDSRRRCLRPARYAGGTGGTGGRQS